jgi:hypothetical protein
MNTGGGVRAPGLKPPAQAKFADEKINDFRIMPQADYDASYKRLGAAPILDGQRYIAVGEPSFVASYQCPIHQTEYRVVKMFKLRDWEIG